MPEESNSEPTARKKRAVKRPAAKRPSSRKRAVKPSAAAAPAATATPTAENRLKEVARTIGSTVGGMVAKTKRALKRDSGKK